MERETLNKIERVVFNMAVVMATVVFALYVVAGCLKLVSTFI